MLQHQVVQSTARLGLTNPNSPSLQNSTPPKFPLLSSLQQLPPPHHHHHQQQQHPPNNSATSSALLPLLPLFRRAQSLLLQMASLASKSFEFSPNRSLWLSTIRGSLPSFLSSQIQSMPPPPLESNTSSTNEILSLFTSLQTQLFEAVAELQEILDLQDAKQRIARHIKSKDSALLKFANKLREAERVLDILVDDYSDYRRPKHAKSKSLEDDGVSNTTVASQLELSDILSYAHRISYSTFAPPDFGAGQAPLRGALPPAPQEEQMRASQLYASTDLDVGLPKNVENKEKIIEAIIEPPPPPKPSETNPLPNFSAIQSLLLPISQFHLGGNLGCQLFCLRIYPRRPQDGSLGTHCLHWSLFLCLGWGSNNCIQLLLRGCISHLRLYKFDMYRLIFLIKVMIVVIIAVRKEVQMMKIEGMIV